LSLDRGLNANNPAQLAVGDRLAEYLTSSDGANAIRMGIQEVIWNRKIWSVTRRNWR